MRFIAGAAAVATSVALSAHALPVDPVVVYQVSFPAPEHRFAQVSVTFPDVSGTLQPRMSRSSPGRYAVHEFAKNVYAVHAAEGGGRELQPTRPNPYQWDVPGHDGRATMTCKV